MPPRRFPGSSSTDRPGFDRADGWTLLAHGRREEAGGGGGPQAPPARGLLTDVIGLPGHKAHREAGRWEHVISDEVEVEERLIVLLGHPTTCPHGNPNSGARRATSRI